MSLLAVLTAVRSREPKPDSELQPGAADLRMVPRSAVDASQDHAAVLRASEARTGVVPCSAGASNRLAGPRKRPAPLSPVGEEVVSALTNLGYRRTQATAAFEYARQKFTGGENFDAIFRVAIASLSDRN
jgi:hypothetical protein